MRFGKVCLLVLSVLIMLAVAMPAVSANEQVTKVTYISYSANDALQTASETNDHSDLIEYTFIDYSDSGISQEMINASESGFLETQDVIVCQGIYDAFTDNTTVNTTLKSAHDKGTAIYSIDPMGAYTPPSYFDYHSDGTTSDPVATYYNNMGTEGEGLENAENLLTYLTMKSKVTYISYSANDALQTASETNDHSDLIEYTFIDYSDSGISQEMINASESGFLETQDVIVCQGIYDAFTDNTTVNATLKSAHDKGTAIYSIDPMGAYTPPSYFDYHSDGTTSDPVATYYNNMGTEGEGLENAENLLTYLATESPKLVENALNNAKVDSSKYLFVLGTEFNENALNNATLDANISSELDITVFTRDNPAPEDFDFSEYGVIFIESQNESVINNWTSSIKSAKAGGAMVMGYNLSSNITVPNVDLYSDEYTDIERYWIQGENANMQSMLRFMGQEFSELWAGETVSEPEIIHSVINVTYIINSDNSISHLNNVLSERAVINDRFNVTVMDGAEAAANLTDVSDQDVIILYMIGATQITEIKDVLLDAKDNGAQIGMFGMDDGYGIATFDMTNPPYSFMKEYLYNNGYSNMEHWIRSVGSTLEGAYIAYSEAFQPSIPDHGIYHPDAFPRVFENSSEYLEWYKDYGYNESAPTVGIIASYNIEKNSLAFNTEDQIIRNLESKGCNVIFSTYKVITDDTSEYFVNNGTVLVDSMISLKGFNFQYNDPAMGIESMNEYNVPVIKGLLDRYHTPDEYNASVHGLSTSSLSYQVTMPELEGLIDYIWLAGRVQDSETGQYYYKPLDSQVDWISDRAISWAELGNKDNSDKKVSIIYYNHEGGKNNIGASYLDIASSFEVLLDEMNTSGYDTGNGSIPNSSEFIDLFIESRNVGSWAPGELEKVVESGNVTLVPVDEYMEWYNTLPQSVRDDVEARWGEAPGDIMVYDNKFVIPTVQMGNINFIPQPTRGDLSDESVTYHDKDLPPTHQYLATYFWINQDYDADAMIHFGTHGTQEWLPGKEVGLWRYDYPSIMVADTPVVYPYIMDNVGEGTQAKRRGNAVIIDHLTPPITDSGLYGELAEMHDKIHEYEEAATANDTVNMALYRNSTIEKYENLSMEYDLEVTSEEMRSMNETEFENFVTNDVHNYLHELQGTLMPLGLHVFGVAPDDEKLVCMVKSMLRSDFIDHIVNVIPHDTGDEEDWENTSNYYANDLLNATLIDGTNISQAQMDVLGLTDSNITADLNTALNYSAALQNTTREIDQALRALDGGYIEAGPGNDPIRNPDAVPTGKNFYSFDPRDVPDEETVELGAILANQMLEQYKSTHNDTYPKKVTYVLWAVETMRHEGLMEAQIYSLLGVEPTRTYGHVSGFKVIPQENMTHPRIDVVVTPSGLYRDTFPNHLQLIDDAVRTVAALNETNETNYVRWNSLKMEEALLEAGYNESTALALSRSRIFSESPGAYGTGLPGAVTASDTWDSEDELADLYISRMSNIYGQDVWGDSYQDVFRMNLQDVEVAMHSDSSNLYGIIDNDDFYQYLGGLSLAVRSVSGDNPEMYVADFKNVDNPQVITYEEAYRKDIRSTLFNPKFISGMMEYDYAGAREFMNTVEHIWGLDVTTPDMVTDSDWDEIYDVYVKDKYDLGVDDFMKSGDNAYAYQSTLKRMIEAERKGYWKASDEVLQNLVKEYTESVVENGVTCCHHTCGNPTLDGYVEGMMSVAGVSAESQEAYKKLMDEATQSPESSTSSTSTSGGIGSAQIVNTSTTGTSSNQTTSTSDGGYGESAQQPTPDSAESSSDYVEGYEMTKENPRNDNSGGSSFSGADIVGTVLVLAAVGAMYIGFRRRQL
ncbi:protoporphyrin IX magnesium chelatase [Methanohalophilus halophilus]|uniref:Protoporphyrin IX magnesium chelatase n=7 Tax=Methanohalophilus halophilus TaxID=2177 RepID=A0A1L3Q3D3_9EURY|nr:protoporphyrin IX magnesium chelatase [Methanohalophilus halophilus]